MKTVLNIFIGLFLLCTSVDLDAQFGVRAGVNLANMSVDPQEEGVSFGTKLGLGIGVFYKLAVADNFAIQPELNFMQHGSKFDLELFGVKAESSFNFNYLQVPVLAKYGFGDMEGTNFYVQGGPYLGLGIGKVKSETCLDGECETEEQEYGDGEDGPKNPDFGLQLGAGVNINSNISVDARYILGLQNLAQSEEGSLKHNGIFISVGYSF
jgi:opacity protein-like surface antigen